MSEKKITKLVEPLGEGSLRIARIEYQLFIHDPARGQGAILSIHGTNDYDPEDVARSIFKLLVENGWVSNPVLSKTTHYDKHKSIHAEYEEKPPSPKGGR